MLIPPNDLFYTTSQVDRLSLNRKDTAWVESGLQSDEARFILLHHSRNLFDMNDQQPVPKLLSYTEVSVYLPHHPWAFLGQHGAQIMYVIDLSIIDEQDLIQTFTPPFFFEDLRKVGPLFERDTAALFAYGRALMYWHMRHQFCGSCGSHTEIRDAGHVRHCLNPTCNLDHFPRTDPAVIMLVHKDDKCLLAHHGRLKKNTYSTLAGFVEPGETLEHAVRREVLEESGIHVSDVRYAGSQPWPFPTALMMGFYAKAETSAISLDDNELLDAQWFTRDDLRNFPVRGFGLSSKDSIARCLIDGWLNNPDF
jgi:NAD+ diphosphatase